MSQKVILGALLAGFCGTSPYALAQNIEPLQGINAKLADIVSANAKPGEVQIATLPAVVQWNDDGGRYAFYQLCDVLSTWGPEVKPSNIALNNRYMQYLLGIKAKEGDPLADEKQRVFADKAAKAMSDYDDERIAILAKWDRLVIAERNLPEANKTAYATFMKNQGAKLASLQISALNAYSQWQPLAAKAAPSMVGFALNEILNPASRVKVKTYSGAELNVLECSPSIDLKQELANAQQRVAANAPADLVLKYGRRTGEIRQSWQRWGGSSGWGPFSVSANGSRSSISIDTNNFQLTVEVPVIIRFQLTRPWMNFSIIQTYKDSSILPGSELAALSPLFGEKGSFPLVPVEFIVGYKPRVTLTMDKKDYSQTKSNYSGGGGFSVGPFRVGGGVSGGSNVEKWDDNNSTVVIGTSAGSFVLLGIVNRVLP